MNVSAGKSSQARRRRNVATSGRRPLASREKVEGLRPKVRPNCRQLSFSVCRRASMAPKKRSSSKLTPTCSTLAAVFDCCNMCRDDAIMKRLYEK